MTSKFLFEVFFVILLPFIVGWRFFFKTLESVPWFAHTLLLGSLYKKFAK
jgi:hypothetical protein